MSPPLSSLRGRVCALGLATLSSAAPLAAQGSGASESGVVTAQGVAAAGGASTSTSGGVATATVSQPLGGPEASSASFSLRTGVAWSATGYSSDAPLVTGVRAGTGDALGGDGVTVFGFNFLAPGAGVTAVDFDGGPGLAPVVVGNTELAVTTPPGTDGFANPLPLSAVSVTNALGSHGADDAFRYLPAFEQGSTAHLGNRVKVRLHTEPNALNAVLLGGSLPGVGVPVAPYEGSLRTLTGLQIVGALPSDATGYFGTTFALPANPAFLGAVIELQAMSFEDPGLTTGAFTNLLQITVQP